MKRNHSILSASFLLSVASVASVALVAPLAACSAANAGDATAAEEAAPLHVDQAGFDSSAHVAHEQAVAQKTETAALDAMFGPFVRKEALVYRGTFKAHDNSGSQGAPFVDGDFPEGPAVALLTFDPFGGTESHGGSQENLAVVSALGVNVGVNVELGQNGTRTSATGVNAPNTSGGTPFGDCDNCFPSLASKPAVIAASISISEPIVFPSSETHGALPGTVTASANLKAIPANELVFANLAAVSQSVDWAELSAPRPVDSGFTAQGSSMVETVHGTNAESLSVEAGMLPCGLDTDYQIDRWVASDDISQFGTKNFKIGASTVYCAAGTGPESGSTSMPLTISETVHTGVGNSATLKVTTTSVDSKLLVTRSVHVAYTDVTHFLGSAASAQAVVLVHTPSKTGEVVRHFTLDLTLAGSIYSGNVALPDVSTITSIELAFSDSTGHTWDSNNGHNYRVTF